MQPPPLVQTVMEHAGRLLHDVLPLQSQGLSPEAAVAAAQAAFSALVPLQGDAAEQLLAACSRAAGSSSEISSGLLQAVACRFKVKPLPGLCSDS